MQLYPLQLTYSYMFFFFNDTATTEIYTLSLHDALPICKMHRTATFDEEVAVLLDCDARDTAHQADKVCASQEASLVEVVDRKSTRLNSSHANISYAVFCLKKKKNIIRSTIIQYYKNERL